MLGREEEKKKEDEKKKEEEKKKGKGGVWLAGAFVRKGDLRLRRPLPRVASQTR